MRRVDRVGRIKKGVGKPDAPDIGDKANVGRIKRQLNKCIIEFTKDIGMSTPFAEGHRTIWFEIC
jgi:hypothetical protein